MKPNSLSHTEDALFTKGLPAPITPDDWRRYHLQSFPIFALEEYKSHADDVLREAIEAVYSMWVGVSYLWKEGDPQVWYEKTRLCYRLLICWYIADVYPRYAPGILSTGGLPIAQKKIGPINIAYNKEDISNNDTDLLKPLLSNAFGAKAHLMIKTCYRRARITNGSMRRN